MKTDKQIYLLLGTGADAFRFITGGIELPGPYRGRSVAFKELERRADHVFEPESGAGPAYIIEIQAQRGGDVYDRLVLELVLYRKAHPGRTVYGLVMFLDAGSVKLSNRRHAVGACSANSRSFATSGRNAASRG